MDGDGFDSAMPKGSDAERIYNASVIGGEGFSNAAISRQLAILFERTEGGFRRMEERFNDQKDLAKAAETRMLERVGRIEAIVVPRSDIEKMAPESKADRDNLRVLCANHESRLDRLETANTVLEISKKIAWFALVLAGGLFTTVIAPHLLHLWAWV